MQAPRSAQLRRQLNCCRQLPRNCAPCGWHPSTKLTGARRVVALANDSQKNQGVYFEYEPIDPDAADELELPDQQEDEFSWAQRSRDKKKVMQQKHRAIDRALAGGRNGNRPRRQQGDRRGPRKDGQHRQAAEARAVPRDGPVLPDYSPVETPAMRPRAVTPEELLVRPRPPVASPAGSSQAAEAADTGLGAGPAAAPVLTPQAAIDAATVQPASSMQPGEEIGQPEAVPAGSSLPSTASGSGTVSLGTAGGTAAGPSAGNSRRQRLLQRMKGGVDGGATETPVAAAGQQQEVLAAVSHLAASQRHPEVPAKEDRAEGATLAAAAAAATLAAGLAPSAVDADLRRQLSSLAAQLPAESALPEEARPARALLESILSPADEDVRAATAGDVADMLERDLRETREFKQWMRRAAAAAGGAGQGQGTSADDELTEAEAADLAAALANLDLDLGGDLGADLDLGDALGGEGGDGDEAVGAALREVSELRRLMAALDAADQPEALRKGAGDAADMTDEQVLAALRTRDPALYEMIKDVPDFDKLGLDLDLDLDLDSATGQLTEAELAELAAEAAAGGDGGDDEDLEALLRDMRGMGLMRDGAADDDDDGGELEDDEGALGLGDLLEALDEDESVDPAARMRAQFALQSMFNQPADELAAKGSRGAGGGGGADGEGAAEPPSWRGTTGMARGAVSADDEDGGAAPPPMLPRPVPKRR